MDLNSLQDEIINYKNKYGDKKTIEEYEENLLNIRNLDLLIWFYNNVEGVDINKIIDLVISTRNVQLIMDLAWDCDNARGKKLSEAIVKYGEPNDIYQCASMELGYLDILTDGIIQKGTADDMDHFARGIEGADVTRLVFEACKADDLNHVKYNRMSDWDAEDLDFKRLEFFIIQSKNVCLMSEYLQTCKIKNEKVNFVSEFENAVLESNDISLMLEFAESGFGADVNKLVTRAIDVLVNEFENSGKIMRFNTMALYSLALKVKADNISALEDLVFEHGYPESIRVLAVNAYIKDTPSLKKALTALLKTNDLQQIYWYRINTMILESDDPIEKEIVDIVYNHPIRHFAIIMDMPDASFEEIEDAVINSGTLDLIYDFAVRVEGANTRRLEDAIIKAGNVEYILRFAEKVEGADVSKLEDAVIKIGDIDYVLRFAQNVNGVNISRLEDVIIDKYERDADLHLIVFASSVKGANISKLEDAVIKIGVMEEIIQFASEVPLANLERLQKYVLDYGCENNIYDFAASVKGADIDKLEDALLEDASMDMLDIDIIIDFAQNIPLANIAKFEDNLISNNYLNSIVLFAKNVDNANISKLEDAIIKSNDGEYIFRFVKNVKGADLDKLIPEIFKLEFDDGICMLLCNVSYDYHSLMENFIISGDIDTVCSVISYLYMYNERENEIDGLGYYVTLLNKRATLDNIEIKNCDGEFYVVDEYTEEDELAEEDKILRLYRRF